MFALLILLFIVLPIAEIVVILQVGKAIGPWWTILLIVAGAVAGAQLLRWQGRSAWLRFQEAISQNRVPHREILDGVMIVVGGTLLLTPGFITDAFGLMLLLPPTRSLIRRLTVRYLTPASMARFVFVRVRDTGGAQSPQPPRRVDQPSPKELPPP